jgi:phosphatidate cytidylyltransferase
MNFNGANAVMELLLSAPDLTFLDSRNFRQRLISALVIIPVALLAIYVGRWVYPGGITVIVSLGLREWLRMVDPQAPRYVVVFAHASLLLIMAVGASISAAFGAMLGTVLVLILFLLAARHDEDRAGWIALGIPYMAGSGLALLYLRATPEIGVNLMFYLTAVVGGTDIGAYLAGRLIGGPKLVPKISPNKTWSGLFGGMLLAAILGSSVAAGCGARYIEVAAGLAVLLAGVSQLGDVFESFFKRRSGLKESGGLIPGHGGILDRIDGLVFAAIFFVLFQVAIGDHMQWW